MNNTTQISKILYVDDDCDDCNFLTDSFAARHVDADLSCISNGEEAMSYLHSLGSGELPSLIILDLNMPKLDGKQTLRDIKSDPKLSSIPVVMLSTSQSKLDKDICVRLGAEFYLEKPHHHDGYKDIVNHCLPLLRRQVS